MPVIPCATVLPVLGIGQFSPAEFVAAYPEFTGFSSGGPPPTAAPVPLANFGLAQLLLNNTCGSRVIDANQRLSLLYLLTAHLTFLSNGTNDGGSPPIILPPPGIVGRINTASEGAVSVGSEFAALPNANQAYLIQTKYGALYWTLTARYRTMLYVCAPGPVGPWGPATGGPCGC
jgi:hypothetical protein